MYLTRDIIKEGEFFGQKADRSHGGICSFLGRVRDHNEGQTVSRLYYESYEPMAEKMIGRIIREVADGSKNIWIRVLHRLGWLEPGEISVIIECSAVHRGEAFAACRTVIDRIKVEVPIWKKEVYSDGTNQWTGCSDPVGPQ